MRSVRSVIINGYCSESVNESVDNSEENSEENSVGEGMISYEDYSFDEDVEFLSSSQPDNLIDVDSPQNTLSQVTLFTLLTLLHSNTLHCFLLHLLTEPISINYANDARK